MNTSISDNRLMEDSCRMIETYEEAWVNFRCTPGFLFAMENADQNTSRALAAAVPETDLTPELFAGDIGNPPRITLPDGRLISPTMLRYSIISRDLGRRFQMHRANIYEVGCGFGGQIKVLRDHFERGGYIGIDTEPMIGVAKKYARHFGHDPAAFVAQKFIDLGVREVVRSQNAIFLSNYALSEMNRETQEFYLTSLVVPCPRGYAIWNAPKKDFDSMDMDAFIDRLKQMAKRDIRVEAECVPTDPSIRKITWGKD